MKRLLLILTLGIIVVVLSFGGVIFLAETHPFVPGDALYAWQRWAEQVQIRLTSDMTRRADIFPADLPYDGLHDRRWHGSTRGH